MDERDSLWDLTDGIHGLLIGDKGYIRPILTKELSAQGIQLQTPLRKNMIDPRPRSFVAQLMSTRRLVETVIGQLTVITSYSIHYTKLYDPEPGLRNRLRP